MAIHKRFHLSSLLTAPMISILQSFYGWIGVARPVEWWQSDGGWAKSLNNPNKILFFTDFAHTPPTMSLVSHPHSPSYTPSRPSALAALPRGRGRGWKGGRESEREEGRRRHQRDEERPKIIKILVNSLVSSPFISYLYGPFPLPSITPLDPSLPISSLIFYLILFLFMGRVLGGMGCVRALRKNQERIRK